MKFISIIVTAVCTTAAVDGHAQQSITTFGGSGWPQTTIISPTSSGYNYTTWNAGPRSGQWGGVTASPGTSVSAAVGPRGQIVPIVTPTAPAPILNPQPVPVSYPEIIPIPVKQHTQEYIFPKMPKGFYTWTEETFGYKKGQKITSQDKQRAIEAYVIYLENHAQNTNTVEQYPKWKAEAEKKEYKELFQKVTDTNQFWKDFYADWQIAPQTPTPVVYMIPYLRIWTRNHIKTAE